MIYGVNRTYEGFVGFIICLKDFWIIRSQRAQLKGESLDIEFMDENCVYI